MGEKPLGLPAGSVRAILALLIVGAAIVGVFVLSAEAAGLLLGLSGVVTTFYFKARGDEETEVTQKLINERKGTHAN